MRPSQLVLQDTPWPRPDKELPNGPPIAVAAEARVFVRRGYGDNDGGRSNEAVVPSRPSTTRSAPSPTCSRPPMSGRSATTDRTHTSRSGGRRSRPRTTSAMRWGIWSRAQCADPRASGAARLGGALRRGCPGDVRLQRELRIDGNQKLIEMLVAKQPLRAGLRSLMPATSSWH